MQKKSKKTGTQDNHFSIQVSQNKNAIVAGRMGNNIFAKNKEKGGGGPGNGLFGGEKGNGLMRNDEHGGSGSHG